MSKIFFFCIFDVCRWNRKLMYGMYTGTHWVVNLYKWARVWNGLVKDSTDDSPVDISCVNAKMADWQLFPFLSFFLFIFFFWLNWDQQLLIFMHFIFLCHNFVSGEREIWTVWCECLYLFSGAFTHWNRWHVVNGKDT